MESIVKFLEKGQPYFDKVSKNIYLQAIKDGFLAAMPIILSSSVFLLISTLPGVVATVGGFTLPDWWNVDVVNFCNKVYNFTMGVVGIMVAGTTASALTGSKNRRMPAGKAINATSTMVAAMCAMLILAVTQTSAKIDGADVSVFFTDNMGTKGLLSSFVAAFATVNIYAFCIKRDITIKLPKEVPGAIAQNFRDIFAFSFSILFVAVIDVICRTCLAVPFANVISTLVSPLFAAADSYAGLALIWFMIPLFWFMGIHGPSVVKPALNAALFGNITTNLATLQAGGHPALALTENFGNYIGELGGTGTAGGVSHWLGGRFADCSGFVIGGLFRRFAEAAAAEGFALLPQPTKEGYSPFGWDGNPHLTAGVPFDRWRMSEFLDRQCGQSALSMSERQDLYHG